MRTQPGGEMMDYLSAFAPHITGLIQQKRVLGYKYDSEPGILRRFDTFCRECHPGEVTITRELMLAWAIKRPGEHPATLQGRITPVKELAKYMMRLGYNAFCLPKGMMPRIPRYMPHIYSNDELKRIFIQTDRCHYCSSVPHRHLVMPVFFRLLYSCGLRVTDARLLKVEDVDLSEGVITVMNAKLDRHHQLPVSPDMLTQLKAYRQNTHLLSSPKDCFFPGRDLKPMTIGNVEKNLRKFLWKAGISHGGRGKGPRVHDFRHTFAVHCLRRWVLEGTDLRALLPVLQTYLGHVSLGDTAYYLHLTADLFPNITEQVERVLGNIIPETGGYDETN
ncbi:MULTISPECIES: tyrosine-type recombinase/integrase [unclassified Photorhabdus]|uniref:tyrosine-type recombinase/integrase n=1 Tax=unclassified Photorhabdus TaxID=2620880 RepID=UPI000DCAF544|nr:MULTISPECIES: tyrosine-type recombinase/integrase [unclassified Photorhabdus]RAW92183.1 integrase [Photorhabdus sp. S10-54]RAW92417.1 integrase [Photorhabdus sp. S9-53]RAW95785.1 integrase [Photorhabdus sp. S8-52]